MALVDGKVALVTGAGSGIGRATALLLAEEGAAVVAADVNEDAARSVVAEIAGRGGSAQWVQLDVSVSAQVEAAVRHTVAAFGKLDCAVNSAGIAGKSGPFADLDEETWARLLAVNLTGMALCIKHQAAVMRSGGGSIVNVASAAALQPRPGSAAYSASKHGVVGLTKVASLDHASQGIRVNALCPGLIATPLTQAALDGGHLNPRDFSPMGRAGRPEEVAQAALWLCSDRASYVTGVALPVDGAHTAGRS